MRHGWHYDFQHSLICFGDESLTKLHYNSPKDLEGRDAVLVMLRESGAMVVLSGLNNPI